MRFFNLVPFRPLRSAPTYGRPFVAIKPPLRRLSAAAAGVALALTSLFAVDDSVVAQQQPVRIVALGDSLTAGYGLSQSAAFPAVLERALRAKGYNVTVANAGVSGDTASAGLARLDWSVPDGTDAVILELGANDMLRGVSPPVTQKALDEIIGRLKKRGVAVMLAGMRASANLGPEYAGNFNPIYPSLAKKHGVVLYPFFLDGVAGVRGLNLADGLHPSAEGVARVVEGILPSVERFIRPLVKGA